MRLFRRHREHPVEWTVEDTAGRLGRVLAQVGPHDERIKHHRTQEGNTDPTRDGLALCAAPARTLARVPGRLLRIPKQRRAARA